MRILHITDGIPPSVLGGAGRIVTELADAQRKQGHEVHMLTAAVETRHAASLHDGVHIHTLPRLPKRFAAYRCVFSNKRARAVLEIIESVKPDIIHTHVLAWQIGYRWMPVAHAKKIPIIATCHDVSHVSYGRVWPTELATHWKDFKRFRWSYNPWRNSAIKRYLTEHAHLITVSDALRAYMQQKGFADITVVHNGIDLSFWNPSISQSNARTHLRLPADVPLFLLAGRLGPDKGTEIIERAFPTGAELVIAGESDVHWYRRFRHRVHVFPNQTPGEMRQHYRACDAVLVPSVCLDCFPTVCLEAMACGRPVLATSWGGAKESVVNGKTGWIMDPLESSAWKEKLHWCVEHRDELQKMGVTCRKHVEEHFSLESYAQKIMHVYETAKRNM